MVERFRGRGVLVTGGATGVGRAIAAAFLEEGAAVVIADVDRDRAAATADQLGSLGDVVAVGCDVAKAAEVAAAVAFAEQRLGGVDVLVNNAGVSQLVEAVAISEDDWDRVMAVNAKGVFLMMRAVLPGMLERGRGNVVNISSQAGKRGIELNAHYCASKAAVILFSRAVALELAPRVRVNCICPGIVATEMIEREYVWEEQVRGTPREENKRRWLEAIPMGRLQEPEHIARATLFIASDDASEITGQALNVDGGIVME